MTTRCDVAVIGAGPIGLAFAISLADKGFTVTVLERADAMALAEPEPDGREIALTHRSIAILRHLGVWARLPASSVAPLRAAQVFDGTSPYALRFEPDPASGGPLGVLVANHLIRRGLHAEARQRSSLRILAGCAVTGIVRDPSEVRVYAACGATVTGQLAVAADTRLSAMRHAQGISAARVDFGTLMLLCRMTHALPHGEVATERFAYGQSIATLPMNGRASSIVITRRSDTVARLATTAAPIFEAEVKRDLGGSLGVMRLDGRRHVQPLLAVHARRFVAPRFALIGDAAVGMHPVTALGFNLGLRGLDLLARELGAAVARGADIGDPAALRRYEAEQSRLTWPLWIGTNTVARLYAAENGLARVARWGALRLADRFLPFRQAVSALLTDPS